MENQVTGIINPDSLAKITDCLHNIRVELPFLIELSPKESKALLHLQAERRDFVNKALEVATQNEQLKPQFFELGEMAKDCNLYTQLGNIMLDVAKLLKEVTDTRNLAGHEAFNSGLEVYSTAKRGAAKGVKGAAGAYDELSRLFDGQGRFPKAGNDTKQP